MVVAVVRNAVSWLYVAIELTHHAFPTLPSHTERFLKTGREGESLRARNGESAFTFSSASSGDASSPIAEGTCAAYRAIDRHTVDT